MKALNVKNMGKAAAQQGFTIIELVVVILLLGILTATALPRFMDVTDEAHDAVVDAVQGGFVTGGALFRAQYIGKGEILGAVVADFGDESLFPDDLGTGYPAGDTDGVLNDHTDCLAIYNGLLQSGRPSAVSVAFAVAGAARETAIEGASADFVITPNAAASTATACLMHYTGQFASGNVTLPTTIPVLTYTMDGGDVTASTVTFNQAD